MLSMHCGSVSWLRITEGAEVRRIFRKRLQSYNSLAVFARKFTIIFPKNC